MTDMTPIADDTAATLTFGLLRDAYLDLAQTLLRIEQGSARDLLQAIEKRAALRLSALEDEIFTDPLEQTALAMAASPVLAVLREAQAA
ncbi:hypothetical protein MET9862_03389 [Methylobacterium symbioticum]|jgi:hypothetical protein|uniref:Uncharacterized protein n=2 Tax=Methylobacterium symbioticum TaxID=2584084 RepID=A0A509EH59_9HYPH|nr:hypothetical protein MET9862_03389 [Methylobacterium symbioticum]